MRSHVHALATRFLIGLVVIGMVFIPATNLLAQTVRVGARTSSSFVPPGTSNAIAAQFQKDMAPIINHAVENRLTAADYASTAESIRMVFANWNESGFTKILQAYILAHQNLILQGPDGLQIHEAWEHVHASLPRGSLLTEGMYARTFQSSRADRAMFINMIQKEGLQKFQDGIIQRLQELSATAARHSLRSNVLLATTSCSNSVAFYAGAASTYLAIVALAAAATGPVAGGIAVASALFGLVSLVASC